MNSLSRDEIRNLDRCAIEILGIPGLVLMENAGRAAADVIEEFLRSSHLIHPAERSVAIVAGAGNNGGDGAVEDEIFHDAKCNTQSTEDRLSV